MPCFVSRIPTASMRRSARRPRVRGRAGVRRRRSRPPDRSARPRRPHTTTGEHQLVRARGADQPRQEPARAHVAVGHADVQEDRAKDGLGRREPDVAAERERQPEARRRTVHRRDHRLRRLAQLQDQPRHVLLVPQAVAGVVTAVVARRLAVAAQVEPDAERLARARQHDRPARAVGREPIELLVQRVVSSAVIALRASGRSRVSTRTAGDGLSVLSIQAMMPTTATSSEPAASTTAAPVMPIQNALPGWARTVGAASVSCVGFAATAVRCSCRSSTATPPRAERRRGDRLGRGRGHHTVGQLALRDDAPAHRRCACTSSARTGRP